MRPQHVKIGEPTVVLVKGGTNICGVSIGVLALESCFPKPPERIENPSSLPFALTHQVVGRLKAPELLGHPDAAMITPLIEAAKRLQNAGSRAIFGSRGCAVFDIIRLAGRVRTPCNRQPYSGFNSGFIH